MSSSSSADGPGRFSSGLCDIQHRATCDMGFTSLGQVQDVEQLDAQLV